MLSNFFSILAILLIFAPQQFSQQEIITKSNTIEVYCLYSFDPQNRYGCYLFNVQIFNPTDTLDIVGTHLPGKTDDDVEATIFTNSRISQFNGEVLRKFVNLRTIFLRHSNLRAIAEDAFDVCGNLEELNIANNLLTELKPQMFRNCRNLTTFIAFFNRFTEIPENFFENNRNLEVFDVHGNQLTELSPRVLANAANLLQISISGNRFNDPQAVVNILNGHLRLRRISLFGNQFPMFNFDFFEQFQNLEILDVSGLQNLTRIAWQSLPASIKSLSATGIREGIPENAFHRLTNLTMLFISGSGITTLHADTFKYLTNLESLMIMDGRIKTIQSQLFASQSKLHDLYLVRNEIEEIEDGAFAPLVNLGLNQTIGGLYMMNNNIRRLSLSMFGHHPHLTDVNFNNNRIAKIERGIFSRFNSHLRFVSFNFNECIDFTFAHIENLDENEQLEWCFNNFEGITTTTPPDGCGSIFRKFEVFAIIFVGFVKFLMNFY